LHGNREISRSTARQKADGKQRPLAVAALEDKIVQRATAAVLNAIYEEDFLGFSYGFRPKQVSIMRWMRWSSGSRAGE
jgi:retron-type reverse transcriptase